VILQRHHGLVALMPDDHPGRPDLDGIAVVVD